jgi:predicted RNA binding protein YcfA (HicA-like mRNA interferase family)
MKLPRDVPAQRVVRALEGQGYRIVRQKGSHVRMRHDGPPEHSITVPLHNPLKSGTLHGILAEVSEKRQISMEQLMELL